MAYDAQCVYRSCTSVSGTLPYASQRSTLFWLPTYIRSDNGPEFIARAVRKYLEGLGVATRYIEPGAPWQNAYVESFNGTLRTELLDRELFGNLIEARVLVENWRQYYNERRPHSALNYTPPAAYSASLHR